MWEKRLIVCVGGIAVAAVTISLAAAGCSSNTVIAATGTTIGVELAENPATHVPHAKLGYNRAELAYVPTNRPGPQEEAPKDGKICGAEDTAEVLMEIKYAGIFSWGAGGGIYQRLAVGKTAVQQPGAAYMFARDVSGNLEPETAAQIKAALRNMPDAATVDQLKAMAPLRKAYVAFYDDAGKKQLFDQAAKAQCFNDFADFLAADADRITDEKIQGIRRQIEADADVKAKLADFSK